MTNEGGKYVSIAAMPLLPADQTAYFAVTNVKTSIMCIRVGRRIGIKERTDAYGKK